LSILTFLIVTSIYIDKAALKYIIYPLASMLEKVKKI
jgi:hypothetical protein